MNRNLLVLSLVLVALFAMACGPSATPTAAPTTAPAVQPTATRPPAAPSPTVSVLDAAKKEGKVVIYTSLNTEEFDPILKVFNKTYADIKVEYYRGNSEDVRVKALNEYRANTFLVDILETVDVDMAQLFSAGVLGQYKSPELKNYPASVADPDGYYASARLNLIVVGYNSNLVKKEDAPKKLDDLLDAKWASGKIAVEASDYPMLVYTAKVMGAAKANDFWTKLAAQKPRVVVGHTELANQLAAGEFALSPTVYAHRIQSLKDDKKAPVDWVKSDPVYASPNMVGIAKNRVHPNAAKVFIDWFFSVEGQQALADVGRFPTRPGVKTKPAALLDGLNIFYGDPKSLINSADVQKQWATLFGIK